MLGNLFERRSITYASLWAAGDTPAFNTRAGVPINQDNSLKIAAVYSRGPAHLRLDLFLAGGHVPPG